MSIDLAVLKRIYDHFERDGQDVELCASDFASIADDTTTNITLGALRNAGFIDATESRTAVAGPPHSYSVTGITHAGINLLEE